jgi:hypothetical protein
MYSYIRVNIIYSGHGGEFLYILITLHVTAKNEFFRIFKQNIMKYPLGNLFLWKSRNYQKFEVKYLLYTNLELANIIILTIHQIFMVIIIFEFPAIR